MSFYRFLKHTLGIYIDPSSAQPEKIEIEKQSPDPLCFLSGSFGGSAINWSVAEKDLFSIF